MKQIIILFWFSFLISCAGTEKKSPEPSRATEMKGQPLDVNKTTPIDSVREMEMLFNVAKENGTSELTGHLIKFPDSYKPISWSSLEEINAPSFKYKLSHKLICKGFFLRSDTISKEWEVVFHFDSLGKVVAALDRNDYSDHYTEAGHNHFSFSSVELEKIGIKNKFVMLYKFEVGSKLQIIGGLNPYFHGVVGMTRNQFHQKNIRNAHDNILEGIDTIDYCDDLSGEDCRLYIFKGDTINKIETYF